MASDLASEKMLGAGEAVLPARQITTSNGLLGGGDLSTNRNLTPDYGSAANKVCQGNDSRLSDARTPTAHAASHASGGSDPITPASIGGAALGMMVFGIPGLVAQGVTAYLYPGVQSASATEIKIRIRVACTVKQMAVRSTAAPTTGTDIYTLRKNGSDTALTVTLGTSDTEDENTSDSVAFAPGDDLSVKVVTGALSVAANPMVSLVLA